VVTAAVVAEAPRLYGSGNNSSIGESFGESKSFLIPVSSPRSPTHQSTVHHSPSASTHRPRAMLHSLNNGYGGLKKSSTLSSPTAAIDFSDANTTAEEKLDNAVAALSDIVPSPNKRDVNKDIVPSPNSMEKKMSTYEAFLKERERGWRLLKGTKSLRPMDKISVGHRTPVHQRYRYGL
jgi:hypothetical protein